MAPSLRDEKDKEEQQQQMKQKSMNKVMKKKTLLKKIVDYLMSDSYMYAPLINSRPSDVASTTTNLIRSLPSGAGAGVPSNKSKGVASALSARKTIAKKTEQASRHQQPSLVNIGNKDHSIRTRDLHTNQIVQQPVNNGRPEMVKHMVHFNSCVSSGPRRGVEYNKCPPSSEAAKPKSLLNNNLVCSPAK